MVAGTVDWQKWISSSDLEIVFIVFVVDVNIMQMGGVTEMSQQSSLHNKWKTLKFP